jgi:hypothetical protein
MLFEAKIRPGKLILGGNMGKWIVQALLDCSGGVGRILSCIELLGVRCSDRRDVACAAEGADATRSGSKLGMWYFDYFTRDIKR